MKCLALFLLSLSLGSCIKTDHDIGVFKFCSGNENPVNRVDQLFLDLNAGAWYSSDTGGYFNVHETNQYIVLDGPYPILLPSIHMDIDDLKQSILIDNHAFSIQRSSGNADSDILVSESLTGLMMLYSFEKGLTRFAYSENDFEQADSSWKVCGEHAMTFEVVTEIIQEASVGNGATHQND